jgi:hypothetical protein
MHKVRHDPDLKFLSFQTLLIFALSLTILGTTAIWLLDHAFISDMALNRWAKILALMGAGDFRLENLGLLYPHAPAYLLIPFYYLPNIIKPAAPYFVSCIFGALLLTIWNYHLQEKRYALSDRVLMVVLVAIHPLFLWAVTSGVQNGLSLVMFYLLYLASVRLIREADTRSFIMLGLVLAGYFFVDERTFFIFIAFLPLLPLIAPRNMLDASPASVYLVITMPLIISIIGWAYLNLVFENGAWHFVNSPYASFRGAWQKTPDVEWLREYGGDFLKPMLISFAIGIVSYPVILWLIARARRHLKLLRGTEVLFVHLGLASGFATAAFFLSHPVDMLFLSAAGVMAGIVLLPHEPLWKRRGLYALLLASVVGGWLTLIWKPTEEMHRWIDAFRGVQLEDKFAGDTSLGQWLNANRVPTLIDDHAAYRAIVARGDAEGLLLSFSPQFKTTLRSDHPYIEQIAVLDPMYSNRDQDAHGQDMLTQRMPDMVTQRYPELYRKGMEGYRLVYDKDHWRVYRRVSKKTTVTYNQY